MLIKNNSFWDKVRHETREKMNKSISLVEDSRWNVLGTERARWLMVELESFSELPVEPLGESLGWSF